MFLTFLQESQDMNHLFEQKIATQTMRFTLNTLPANGPILSKFNEVIF